MESQTGKSKIETVQLVPAPAAIASEEGGVLGFCQTPFEASGQIVSSSTFLRLPTSLATVVAVKQPVQADDYYFFSLMKGKAVNLFSRGEERNKLVKKALVPLKCVIGLGLLGAMISSIFYFPKYTLLLALGNLVVFPSLLRGFDALTDDFGNNRENVLGRNVYVTAKPGNKIVPLRPEGKPLPADGYVPLPAA